MAESRPRYGVNFRIKETDNLAKELDRLAIIISKKYKREIRIYLRDRGNGH